ncbi:molybdopterin-binding domain-containing protein [Aeoliella mucimassa]|nr:hypothetical protein [Aeoliella mucimassa]
MANTLTTCTACGSTCDDIQLQIDTQAHVMRTDNACELGQRWFATEGDTLPPATIRGQPATLEQAVHHAAQLLDEAKLPLVTGLKQATIEAIREATALADALGACIDWTTSAGDAAAMLALQTAGAVTATIGEVAQRADMVVVWQANLTATHPRYHERYLDKCTSPWIDTPEQRTLVWVGSELCEESEKASHAILIKPNSSFESLLVLRAIVSGVELDAEAVVEQTGVSLDVWQDLANQMKSARYGAVVHAGELGASRESVIEVARLVAELTATTRWVALPAGSAGNSSGAASVLAWQTGFPLAVNFAQRVPSFGPDEWTTRRMLARGEADTVLVVASDLPSQLDSSAAEALAALPMIALDWQPTATLKAAEVAIRVARPGVECAGTTQRSDGMMLPLRAAWDTDSPTCEAVLRAIATNLAARS